MNQTISNKVMVSRQHNKKYHSRFIVPKLRGGGRHMLYDGRMDQYRYIDTLENYLMPTKDIFFGKEPDWL